MTFIKNKKVLALFIAFFMCGIPLFFINSAPISSKEGKELTPTVFVHGFKGGPGSFNYMLSRFEANDWGMKRMVFRVSANGEIAVRGGIPNKKNPFIQVIFENNRASIETQTNWLINIMELLKTNYGIKQTNLVGHSMGGLTSTNMLLHQQGNNLPKIEKLVVIASPFLGIDNKKYFAFNTGNATVDLRPESQALTNMFDNKEYFPGHVDVLAIAGVINENITDEHAMQAESDRYEQNKTDGLVALTSALGIKEIVPAKNYQQKIFSDTTATHSGLHEHFGVDAAIAEFLWDIPTPTY
ncbi:alpha/beta fold hydrolase [Thalassobacillus pellis]|uniref:alpha/beta fold hydrolase n=1 Tax=Thalassobacillus pellis TaxID=748008 RepID=UPI001960F9B1|nr:alpha/beta fold hydrolase [Thalassobacillus pellis]MBM7551895.1 putative alpha/beta hydrolase family protein [Thalassobacillus pellis]